jgi:sulfane dehydrogenase subunit SoxC
MPVANARTKSDMERELGAPVAGNGLLHRRAFLHGGVLTTGGALVAAAGAHAAEAVGAAAPPWMTRPGAVMSGYGMPAHWEAEVKRIFQLAPGREPTGASRTPLQFLEGIVTPNGLHFERHHNGVPDIDPDRHELLIHGLVRQPLAFTRATLLRYPMETHIRFIECSGNSGAAMTAPEARQMSAGEIHGLVSCSEWTGVRLSTLLDEAGLDPAARWVAAEGADSAAMVRSVPLEKCMDDAVIAIFQNGEAIRPEQGYPMRLLLPGYEGNANVKWLHRLKVMEGPAQARDETSKYSDLLPDGRALQFTLELAPKSTILKPSYGLTMQGPGFYEISGLAWTGAGRVARVEVSADGGRSWAEAALQAPVLSKALTRFRMPWRWDGGPAVLMSRTFDESGITQPARDAWLAQYGARQTYHYNAIQAWSVETGGEVRNVYA